MAARFLRAMELNRWLPGQDNVLALSKGRRVGPLRGGMAAPALAISTSPDDIITGKCAFRFAIST